MFSVTSEYALRSVAVLHHSKELMSTDELAKISRVPREYLGKVVGILSKKGIVSASKGRGGGVRLNPTQENISLLEVVDAVDPIKSHKSCPFKIKEHEEGLCQLHKVLNEITQEHEASLRETTFSGLKRNPELKNGLCWGDSEDVMKKKTRRGRLPLSQLYPVKSRT